MNAPKKNEPPVWFRPRGYPHFDRRLSPERASELVTDPRRIARHPFLPFLTFEIAQPRYKPKLKQVVIKKRPIAVASHADAHIFAYYAFRLTEPYERMVQEKRIGDAVLAYRRFSPPKSNIHFAGDAFTAIERMGECHAVALDIESFFDTISHVELKRLWSSLLGATSLPDDHYAVFRAVTRFARVEREQAFEAFGIGLRRRESWRGPLCTPEQFRRCIRGAGLITANSTGRGIPQGSPISALLSNIYMLELDQCLQRLAEQCHGVYRRYSDDVLLIGSSTAVARMETALKAEVERLGLEINDAKTARSEFKRGSDVVLRADRPLQYLGFTFDGERVLVRSQTIAKYIRRMKAGVRSARRAAIRASRRGGSRRLRREELFARFSHLGPTEAMLQSPQAQALRNNFWSYSKRAARIMDDDAIRRQLRKHWPRLVAEIQVADAQ
ncbi:MAG: hypothetical protein A49_16490 [Methyloceanibacter sp.]|nr:MAG: hypothetical protein A49_16490 [Methyloceanibacter sp.]